MQNWTIYSDRLILSDFSKWESLAEKHFGNTGQDFNKHPQNKIEEFLRDFYNRQDIELVRVSQGRDMSTGMPVWSFQVQTAA